MIENKNIKDAMKNAKSVTTVKANFKSAENKQSKSTIKKVMGGFCLAVTVIGVSMALTGCVTTAKQLNTTEISYETETNMINWKSVDNAIGYIINVKSDKLGVNDTKELGADTTEYKLNLLQNGEYTISVIAKGNGTNFTNSEKSEITIDYQKNTQQTQLAKVNGIVYNKESQTITWNKVANAKGYEVSFNGSEAKTITSESFDIPTEGLENGKEYVFNIKALGDGISYTNSELSSKTIQYQTKDQETQPVQLKNVENLQIVSSAKTITWNEVSDAKGYEVVFNGKTSIVEGISFSVENVPQVGEYELSVKALGDNIKYTDSEISTIDVNVTKAANPNISFKDNVFTWNNSNKNGYSVFVNGSEVKDANGRYEIKNFGTYSVEVTALGDGGFILNSDTQTKQYTYEQEEVNANYGDVVDLLKQKLPVVIKTAHPIGVVTKVEILGINKNDGTIYYTYLLGTGLRSGTVTADGLADKNSFGEIVEAIENDEITFKNVKVSSGMIQSSERAEGLVGRAMERGHVKALEGKSTEDILFATATNFDVSKATDITVVLKDGTFVEYRLVVAGALSGETAYDEYLGGEGFYVNGQSVGEFSDLSEAFGSQQAKIAPKNLINEM